MNVFDKLEKKWDECKRCQIGKFAHAHVFGDGTYPAPFLFVGEGPGVSEDALGTPFIGRSGQLLRDALDSAGFLPKDHYITNLVACRPCDAPEGPNRAPSRVEISNCSTRLRSIVAMVNPQVIVPVGAVAANECSVVFSNYRIRSIKHPAFILRNGGEAGEIYEPWLQSIRDVKALVKEKR